jgi:hypothetical protein
MCNRNTMQSTQRFPSLYWCIMRAILTPHNLNGIGLLYLETAGINNALFFD